MTKAKIAINGFGRIGRLFFRQAFGMEQFDVVAINDLGNIENLAYLLQYDSVYRRYGKQVTFDKARNALIIEGVEVRVFQEKDPAHLPWKDLGVDIAVESTGLFESYEAASAHIKAGAKRAVLTAPAKDDDGPVKSSEGDPAAEIMGKTVLVGVNDDAFKGCTISSNASCTTNSAASVMEALSENPGIVKALLSTVHSMTSTQNLADGPTRGSDFRRGRAAGANISPSTTGAAIAVTRVVPELVDKFDGLAFRVPTIAGSLSDITFLAKRKTSVEEINKILTDAAELPRWQGILKVTNDQLVSSDIIGQPYGALVDLSLTKVVDGDLVKVLSWYDNEFGYVSTLVKHVSKIVEIL
jgi:glyceraldehyde 3-phosphate dehydrogenase